jgi:RNA polymerase sigma-70 factor (ECF subfamily)
VKASKQDPQAEQILLERTRGGSREAFGELVRMHLSQIYHVSLRILKNHADAEDNLQDVFCKVCMNIHRFEGRSRFSTWLIRVTINEALMRIRRRRCERLTLEADLPKPESEEIAALDVEDSGPDQERRYIAKELAAKALRGLHPSVVDIFIRHTAQGWTQRELARQAGVSTSALKSRIFTARAHMQRQLRGSVERNRKKQHDSPVLVSRGRGRPKASIGDLKEKENS